MARLRTLLSGGNSHRGRERRRQMRRILINGALGVLIGLGVLVGGAVVANVSDTTETTYADHKDPGDPGCVNRSATAQARSKGYEEHCP
jgi:hypothetical protein